ncbi:MAG: 1-acyl-sn-glycerol-3-phosphate acyltransferase [Bacteroidota bacterium]
MLWHILKYLLSFSIPAFYRRVKIKNVHYLKNKFPAIITSNHPNAFMDPILFSYLVYPPRVRYMARGDAFKPGVVSALLQSIGIVPIFRMQDAGVEGLKKNNESYRVVYSLLKRNKKVMIFAEGICIQEKRLRPIKKGVPRLIYSAQEQMSDKDIQVIPVCLNYSNASQIGSDVFIYVGEPFSVKNQMQEYKQNPNPVMLQMMNELYQKMLPLIVHIENPNNDDLFEKSRALLDEMICYKRNLHSKDPEHIFIVEKELSEFINYIAKNNQEQLIQFEAKINSLYSIIKQYSVSIQCIIDFTYKSKFVFYLKFFLYSIIYPAYYLIYLIIGAFMYLPYILSHRLALRFSKNGKEFYASFFLAFSTFIFLFYYLLIYFALIQFLHPFYVLMFFIVSLSFIPLMHRWNEFRIYFNTMLKILKNKTFALNLSKNLEQILNEYEYLKKSSSN